MGQIAVGANGTVYTTAGGLGFYNGDGTVAGSIYPPVWGGPFNVDAGYMTSVGVAYGAGFLAGSSIGYFYSGAVPYGDYYNTNCGGAPRSSLCMSVVAAPGDYTHPITGVAIDDAPLAVAPSLNADTTAPVLRLPASPVTAEATSASGATVSYSVSAIDPDDAAPAVSCAPASGSVFALGDSTVKCTATDPAGNSSTGSFTVSVRDTTPPTLSVPAAIMANATSPAGAVVIYSVTATDLVDPRPAMSCTLASGSIFPIATTTVTCTATDASGNTAPAQSFSVTVKGATQQLSDVVNAIKAFNLAPTAANSLITKLSAAQTRLAANQTGAACSVLTDFTNQVNDYLSAKKLSTSQAQQLLTAVARIEAVIGC